MKILVLSDTHSKELKIKLDSYDYIIFAGDMGMTNIPNAIIVKGNCDYDGDLERFITINNKNFYITHGHLYNVKYDLNRLYYRSLSVNSNITIYGHTHIQRIDMIDDLILLNPGSYQDGYYAIIDDEFIRLYKDNKEIKKYSFKWW